MYFVMNFLSSLLQQEVFTEMEEKYGEVEEMNVCDNLGDHLVGNVYVKVGQKWYVVLVYEYFVDKSNRWIILIIYESFVSCFRLRYFSLAPTILIHMVFKVQVSLPDVICLSGPDDIIRKQSFQIAYCQCKLVHELPTLGLVAFASLHWSPTAPLWLLVSPWGGCGESGEWPEQPLVQRAAHPRGAVSRHRLQRSLLPPIWNGVSHLLLQLSLPFTGDPGWFVVLATILRQPPDTLPCRTRLLYNNMRKCFRNMFAVTTKTGQKWHDQPIIFCSSKKKHFSYGTIQQWYTNLQMQDYICGYGGSTLDLFKHLSKYGKLLYSI